MRVSRISRRKPAGARRNGNGFTVDTREATDPGRDPLEMQPDELRDDLRRALSGLSFEGYRTIRKELIDGIRRAGTNVSTALLMIGAATSDGEVLPPDMAHLVRYLRINRPESLKPVRALLSRLLDGADSELDRKARLAA